MSNILGSLGMPDMQFPSMDPINASLAANALKPAPQAQSHGLFHQGGTVSNILGAIGDAFLVQSGHQPVYSQMMAEKRRSEGLRNYLGNIDPGLAEMIGGGMDAGDVIAAYKLVHPNNETPAALKEFEYYKGLQGGDRSSYENFLKLTHPGMMSPVTLGPNDTYDPGTGAEQTATGPNGEKVRYNQQTGQWEPMGGQTAQPSGGFR